MTWKKPHSRRRSIAGSKKVFHGSNHQIIKPRLPFYVTSDRLYASCYGPEISTFQINPKRVLDLSDPELQSDEVTPEQFKEALISALDDEAAIAEVKAWRGPPGADTAYWLQDKDIRRIIKSAGFDVVKQFEFNGECGRSAISYLVLDPDAITKETN